MHGFHHITFVTLTLVCSLATNFKHMLTTCCEEGLDGTEDQHDDHHDGKDRDRVARHVPGNKFTCYWTGKNICNVKMKTKMMNPTIIHSV